jgi:hypothetical protein
MVKMVIVASNLEGKVLSGDKHKYANNEEDEVTHT